MVLKGKTKQKHHQPAVRTATTTMSTVAARPATASRMGVNSVVAAMAATAAAGAFYYGTRCPLGVFSE